MLSEAGLAIMALTTRTVPSDERPMTGRQLAALRRGVDVRSVAGLTAAETARTAGIPIAEAERVLRLLDRSTAVAMALEAFEQAGIWTTTVADDEYPSALLQRLGDAAPPVLHGVGPVAALAAKAIGVVGSRDVTPEGAVVSSAVGAAVAKHGNVLVSGGARGVDGLAMGAALAGDGRVVGVLADSLLRTVRAAETRRAVLDGVLTLATPYAPAAGFSAGQAMARNKIVYALCDHVLVVTSDLRRGGTWSGAVEALDNGYTDVAVWMGDGRGAGNEAIVEHGARGITKVEQLFSGRTGPRRGRGTGNDQLSFAV